MVKLTERETQLLDYLTAKAGALGPEQPDCLRLLLRHGWVYKPTPLPKKMTRGKSEDCFANAAMYGGPYTYCEGFAFAKGSVVPVLHAWVSEGSGNAFDITWAQSGDAYIGIPFRKIFMSLQGEEHRAGMLLRENWRDDWPLLRLYDTAPSVWLELNSKGIRAVRD